MGGTRVAGGQPFMLDALGVTRRFVVVVRVLFP